jgi:PHS family inorganic phosphate transporter-like MFS transporter
MGKLGAIVVQAILPVSKINEPNSRNLGWLFVGFAPLMFLSSVIAWAWIPEVQDTRDPNKVVWKERWKLENKKLEDDMGPKAMEEEGQIIGLRRNVKHFFIEKWKA